MRVIKWEPYREVDDLFGRFMAETMRGWPRRAAGEAAPQEWTPAVDVSETDTEFLIKAELPEVRKEDVSITVQDGMLTISGERKLEKKADDERVHRTERFYGSFSRQFGLPENIDEQAIKAEGNNGVIVVHLPKQAVEEPQPRQIAVQ